MFLSFKVKSPPPPLPVRFHHTNYWAKIFQRLIYYPKIKTEILWVSQIFTLNPGKDLAAIKWAGIEHSLWKPNSLSRIPGINIPIWKLELWGNTQLHMSVIFKSDRDCQGSASLEGAYLTKLLASIVQQKGEC